MTQLHHPFTFVTQTRNYAMHTDACHGMDAHPSASPQWISDKHNPVICPEPASRNVSTGTRAYVTLHELWEHNLQCQPSGAGLWKPT